MLILPKRKLLKGLIAAPFVLPSLARAQFSSSLLMAGSAGGGGGGHCPTCTTGLVGFWNFDENTGTTTADASGNGNTLTLTTASWTTGKINSAVNYNGTTQQCYVGPITNSNVLYLSGAWSVSAWVNMATLGSQVFQFVGMNNGSNPQYQLSINTTPSPVIISIDGGGTTGSFNLTGFAASIWYHFVATYNGTSTITVYWNNSSLGTYPVSAWSGGTTGFYFTVGSREGGTNYWPGIIDAVGVWSRVITSTEVSELYNANSGLQYPF